jgi:5-methylcytosine-specific restriction endonuclease McrA
MGWETSDRRQRLPSNWGALVRSVKRRARSTSKLGIDQCEKRLPSGARCPRPGRDVDHIIPNDDHSESNLRLLCPTHHERKTVQEAAQGRLAYKRSKYRPSEQHPGTLR